MTRLTRFERRLQRDEEKLAQIKRESDQAWLSNPQYHTELAVAQLAITYTKNDMPSSLITERIAEVDGWGAGCHPNQLLTQNELANVEQMTFVVDSIKKAVIGEFCGSLGYNVSDLEGINILDELGTAQ